MYKMNVIYFSEPHDVLFTQCISWLECFQPWNKYQVCGSCTKKQELAALNQKRKSKEGKC